MHKQSIFLALASMLAIGCTNATTGETSQPTTPADTCVILLPSVPDTLRTPESRASYLAEHYWDNVDFCNPVVKGDSAKVEQAFVDFIDILRIVDNDSVIDKSIGTLIAKTAADQDAYKLVYGYAEKYLYETESPMLDEDCYLRFLNVYREYSADDKAMSLRIEDKVANIGRNRVGTDMPDIRLVTIDNNAVTLYDLAPDKPAIVLIYDNDCEYCHEVVAQMLEDTRLSEKLDEDKLVVIAIDLGLKNNHLPLTELPNWIWVWPKGDISSDIVYRDTPSLYVIDLNKAILIKDASYDYVSKAIFH